MKLYVTNSFLYTVNSEDLTKEELSRELRSSYEELITIIYQDSQDNKNVAEYYSRLIYVRSELNAKLKELSSEKEKDLLIKSFINRALEFINGQIDFILLIGKETFSFSTLKTYLKQLQWTGSKSDLIELIYGLIECKVINNGEIEVKQLVSILAELFNIEVKQYYRMFLEIRKRTGTKRAYFLREMFQKLEEKMNKQDNGKIK